MYQRSAVESQNQLQIAGICPHDMMCTVLFALASADCLAVNGDNLLLFAFWFFQSLLKVAKP